MEPSDKQEQNEDKGAPSADTGTVSPETLRVVGMATAGASGLMLVGSVIAQFVFGAYQPALVLAGIALIDPVVMQFVLSRLSPQSIDLSEVDMDSPFDRYFYEKELQQAQGGPLAQMTAPALGAGILLVLVGMVMDGANLSAKVLPLFALWAGTAFVLALYAGSMFDSPDDN